MSNKRKPIILQGGVKYTKVADRCMAWRKDFSVESGYKIVTSIHTLDDSYVVFKCEILNKENEVVSTGHGFNTIAKKSLEKAETVAVGRALTFFDPIYGGDHELASQEEMEKYQELTKRKPQPVNTKPNGVANVVDQAKKQLSNGKGKIEKPTEDLVIPFGTKLKGKKVSGVTYSTLDWCLNTMDQAYFKNCPEVRTNMENWVVFKTQG